MQGEFKKSDITLLVATMNRNSTDFLIPMFPFAHYADFNILVVNQTTPENIIQSDHTTTKVINVFDKGLSKSRNLALNNAEGKLCVVTDDDVVFKEGFESNILNAFNAEPDAALISFRTETALGKLYKKYPEHRKMDLSATDRLNIMSVEMVLNKAVIDQYNIRFDTRFGLGAQFEMGEEAVFINELHKNKLKIVTEPKVMVTHTNDTTHTKMTLHDKYYVQGALFTALYDGNYLLWVFLKILFELKQNKIKISQVYKAVRTAIAGRKDFLQTSNK